MPIEYPEPKAPTAVCVSCGERKAFVPNDDGPGDDDFREPPGWVPLVASRVVPNPAYAEAHAAWTEMRAQMLSQELPPEIREQVEAEEFDTDEPALVRQTIEEIACDACAKFLQTKLGFDEWPNPADDDDLEDE